MKNTPKRNTWFTHTINTKKPQKNIYTWICIQSTIQEKKDTMDKHISWTLRSNGTYNLTLNNTCYSTIIPKYK